MAAGGSYLYAPLAQAVAADAPGWREHAFVEPDSLTPREREVLELLTSGISNRQIADALQLSEGTVRNHVSNIFSKFGVNDRTRAVLHAIERRLV